MKECATTKSSLTKDSGKINPNHFEAKPGESNHEWAEKALYESEQRLSDIIDFLPDATFVIDRDGKIIAWNRAIEEMTGAKAKDMLGKGDYEYALPFYGKRRPLMIDLVLKPDKKSERDYDMVIKKPGHFLIAEGWATLKGEKVFLWGKASPFCNSKGKIVGAVESVRD